MAHTSTFQTWHQPSALTHRMARALQGAWSAYWVYKAERATALILHSLDDRTLKDIGMDRSEIESVVHNPGRDRRVALQGNTVKDCSRLSLCA